MHGRTFHALPRYQAPCGAWVGQRREIAVLFARADSIYKTLPGCDVWDAERDARTWPGGSPVVAHPPCRLWASLRHKSKAPAEEKDLAIQAVAHVRRWGGVLEHPLFSTLWRTVGLPEPGERDEWGGHTQAIHQHWFGHRAQKSTRLYIVGCEPRDMPAMPLKLGPATHTVGLWSGRDRATCRPSISKPEFEQTPPALAEWLVELARRTSVQKTADRA
jgi:hypothetical protein